MDRLKFEETVLFAHKFSLCLGGPEFHFKYESSA